MLKTTFPLLSACSRTNWRILSALAQGFKAIHVEQLTEAEKLTYNFVSRVGRFFYRLKILDEEMSFTKHNLNFSCRRLIYLKLDVFPSFTSIKHKRVSE